MDDLFRQLKAEYDALEQEFARELAQLQARYFPRKKELSDRLIAIESQLFFEATGMNVGDKVAITEAIRNRNPYAHPRVAGNETMNSNTPLDQAVIFAVDAEKKTAYVENDEWGWSLVMDWELLKPYEESESK